MTGRFTGYILQSMFGMIGVSVYILADTFFIALYSGAEGLAVLNLVLPLYGIIYAIGSMTGIGSATFYAIRKSAGKDTDGFFIQSLFWSFIFAIPFMLSGIFVPDRVLAFMGADAKLTALGMSYVRIILIASPLFMMNYTFSAFARNDNAPTAAMVGAFAGSMFNIVFDYIFMFTLGLGFTGAALATAGCPIVTILVCAGHFSGRKNTVGFGMVRPSLRHIFKCCSLGVSACVGELSSAVTTATFNTLILSIAGNIGVAAYGVVANIAIVALSLFNGIAQGSQPMISECCGKEDKHGMKHCLKLGLIYSILTELLLIALAYGFTDGFIAIFNSEGDAELRNMAFAGMREYSLGYIFAGVNVMLIAYFAATDKAKQSFTASTLRGAVAIVVCAVVLSRLFGLQGVWMSFFAAEFITFVVIIVMFVRMHKKKE